VVSEVSNTASSTVAALAELPLVVSEPAKALAKYAGSCSIGWTT
jgi:hypothetical protein